MDVLADIALLHMPGPQFLFVYAVIAAISLLIFNALMYLDNTDARPPSPLPGRPDPYEIAYLRDGIAGVIGVALYALKRMGAIALDDKGQLAPIGGGASPRHPIEAAVLGQIGSRVEARQASNSYILRSGVEPCLAPLIRRLGNQGLLTTSRFRRFAVSVAALIGACLIGLATLKISVALATGHRNVGFLVVETILALIALGFNVAFVAWRPASARGRAYLRRARLSLSGEAIHEADSAPSFANAAALALVGAYGFQVLRYGPDAGFAKAIQRRSSGDGGGDGGGGGGGSCGGGGGCGGCGGGD
jgi:uncharacterized protein (TIGR04222 family)